MNKWIRGGSITVLALALSLFSGELRAQEWTTSTLTQRSEPGKMSFNFEGVSLETVLDAMSRNLGLVIVREVPVDARLNVVSHQSLDADESVELINTILNEKGYAGVRSGKTLTIVSRDDARMRSLPVRIGSDPAQIPSSDEMVTQIIPVRHAKAKEMVADLQGLLPSYARITANESSNAIVLTDTQNNIRRVAEIVSALDQSISEISAIRVFPLQSADAKDTAELIKSIFENTTAASSRDSSRRSFRPPFMRGSEEDTANNSADSAALQASSRVTAAADERTNSVVVGAPDNLMPVIENLVNSLDRSVAVLTEVRVFPLRFANATDMAATINSIFGEQSTSTSNSQTQVPRFSRWGPAQPQQQQNSTGSERQQSLSSVNAVADTRTNSVIVSAVSQTMTQISGIILELDKNPAKTKKVYVYPLQNADPEEVSTMLKEMFGESSRSSSTTRSTNTNTTSTRNTSTRNTSTRNTSGNSR